MEENNCKIRRWEILKRDLVNLSPREFEQKYQSTANALLLDVRTASEYASGSLEEAEHMDYLGEFFWEQFEALDRNRPVFVFCRSGRRSVRVCTLMKNGGFKEIYNMEGGLNARERQFHNHKT